MMLLSICIIFYTSVFLFFSLRDTLAALFHSNPSQLEYVFSQNKYADGISDMFKRKLINFILRHLKKIIQILVNRWRCMDMPSVVHLPKNTS